jgi:hypothetical protein
VYTAEIERSLINVILANQAAPNADPPGIRYFAVLEGFKAAPTNYVTCCESQGTRTYGALPEFVYSTTAANTSPDSTVGDSASSSSSSSSKVGRVGDSGAVYVNLLVPSRYSGTGFTITQQTGFPSNGTITLTMVRDAAATSHAAAPQQVMLRIPSWCTEPTVPVTIRGGSTSTPPLTMTGIRGTYLAIALADSQVIEAHFPMGLRVSLYNGTTAPTSAASGCGVAGAVRATVEWGPVLLAATLSTAPKCTQHNARVAAAAAAAAAAGGGTPLPTTAVNIVGINPRSPVSEWLLPAGFDGVDPLFAVNGTSECTMFRPYYSLQDEAMSVYPTFFPNGGLGKYGECAVTKENFPAETSTVCLKCATAGQRVSTIADARFGVLEAGNCTSGIKFGCQANATVVKRAVEQFCMDERACSVPVDFKLFGSVTCGGLCLW